MKFQRMNFRKVLSLLCAVAIIASTVVVMSVSATAATIYNDENVFTSLTTEETETYEFEGTSNSTGAISEGNGKKLPGIASGLYGGGKIYNRSVNRGTSDNSTFAMKWSSAVTTKNGFILGKTGTNVGNGVDQAYVLEDNTTYKVSYDYYNYNGTALTLNVIGVNAAQDEVLQDADDSYTYTVFDDVAIDATAASKKWTTYTCTFTTGTVGADKYLSFAVFRDTTTALEFWVDNFKITKVTAIDTNDVITFNDNGKTYYAYPDALTTLPQGDNGALDTEFIAWVNTDGETVTEVPAAGTVLNAKYPMLSELPLVKSTVTLPMSSPAVGKNITSGNSNGVYGVVSGTHSSAGTINYREYSSDWGIKIINDGTKGSTGILLGKEDIAYNSAGSDAKLPTSAYALEPNTQYTVSFDYALWSGSSSVAFQIVVAQKSAQSYYNSGIA